MTAPDSDSFFARVPPALRASVERHQTHLLKLTESLRAAGIGDEEIERAVTVLMQSYKTELLEAIRALRASAQGSEQGA